MPIQAPQWTDYLNCPVCCREFDASSRSPISLKCGHTLCRHCLKQLHRKHCPFDQIVINVEPEELVVNSALLQIAGYTPSIKPYHPPCIQALSELERQAYDCIVHSMEHLAADLKLCINVNNSMAGSCLSRPMQRKLVTLLQCSFTDEDGRGRVIRAARSLAERTVTELMLQHQNPQQLCANLWAAVRARGCQFLGPAMQEEVLKLILLALEDGTALSRKVLVMFVVQRLDDFPQASKTSIGHVVQLLYRASCFKVSKRERDSSLMQLKEEFRTYESLRREHDAQIVQIATEAGLRIAPDQWSALLYGDTAHKSHMQSIIDKLQTPQSFSQSVQELFIALHRTGDPAQIIVLSRHLDCLANIDVNPDAQSPSWRHLADVMIALKEVVSGLVHYLQLQANGRDSNHNQKQNIPERSFEPSTSQPSLQTSVSTPTHNKYKILMCRDAATRQFCPRGNTCTFAHSEEELERYRVSMPVANLGNSNPYISTMPATVPVAIPMQQLRFPPPMMMYSGFTLPPPQPFQLPRHSSLIDNYNVLAIPSIQTNHPPPPDVLQTTNPISENLPIGNSIQSSTYSTQILPNPGIVSSQVLNTNLVLPLTNRTFFEQYRGCGDTQNAQYQRSELSTPILRSNNPTIGLNVGYRTQDQTIPLSRHQQLGLVHVEQPMESSPYSFEDSTSERLPYASTGFSSVQRDLRSNASWSSSNNNTNSFNVDEPLANSFNSSSQANSLDIFNVSGFRGFVGANEPEPNNGTVDLFNGQAFSSFVGGIGMSNSELSNGAEDHELEKELQALERRLDTEF